MPGKMQSLLTALILVGILEQTLKIITAINALFRGFFVENNLLLGAGLNP